jgi:Secretion system C-terminal sorting domain/Outer membrane protein Omp28
MKFFMKKLLLFLMLTAIFFQNLDAQTNKRFVLVQHFTSIKNILSFQKNPPFYKTIDSFPSDFIHIGVHAKYPDTDERFYLSYPEQDTFRSFYGIQSAPVIYVNGVRGVVRTELLFSTDQIVKDNLGKTSEVGLKVTESGTSNRTVSVNIKSFAARAAGDYRLHVALVQKTVDTTTTNGESQQRNVIRTLLTTGNGEKITLPAVGATLNKSYTYNITLPYQDQSKMYAVAWINEYTSKIVVNSGTQKLTSATEDNILSENLVEIAPNPVTDQLNIQLYDNIVANNYEIYNMSGQVMAKSDIEKSLQNFDIDVARFNSGMYILRLNSKDGVIVKKFVKN